MHIYMSSSCNVSIDVWSINAQEERCYLTWQYKIESRDCSTVSAVFTWYYTDLLSFFNRCKTLWWGQTFSNENHIKAFIEFFFLLKKVLKSCLISDKESSKLRKFWQVSLAKLRKFKMWISNYRSQTNEIKYSHNIEVIYQNSNEMSIS